MRLGTNPLEAKALSKKVDETEGKIDEKYLETKQILLLKQADVDPATLIILNDLLEFMEHVADGYDNTAD